MSPDRDDLWADMAQFDTRLADGVWDGDVDDPDAPGWYAELVALIRRARQPAEPHELADEPLVVATMRRAALRQRVPARRRGVRGAARVVAMKVTAAAATTSLTGVAAAAATGAVATVAVTMAVPAINRHVVHMIRDQGRPAAVSPAPEADHRGEAPGCDDEYAYCIIDDPAPITTAVPLPTDAAPPATEPASGTTAATTTAAADPPPATAPVVTVQAAPVPPTTVAPAPLPATLAAPTGTTSTTTTTGTDTAVTDTTPDSGTAAPGNGAGNAAAGAAGPQPATDVPAGAGNAAGTGFQPGDGGHDQVAGADSADDRPTHDASGAATSGLPGSDPPAPAGEPQVEGDDGARGTAGFHATRSPRRSSPPHVPAVESAAPPAAPPAVGVPAPPRGPRR